MLSLFDSSRQFGRREFMRIGSLGAAGLTLQNLPRGEAEAGVKNRLTTGKSVIFLFQQGGPSQYETFDPKMEAPSGIRSATGELSTSLPGITFGGTFPNLARHADKLSIVRSYQTGSSAHKIQPIVSEASLNANIGSLYSRIVGPTHPVNGIPTNMAIFANAVDPEGAGPINNFGRIFDAGPFGKAYEPFVPGSGGDLQENMKLSLASDRLNDRRALLDGLSSIHRELDRSSSWDGMDQFQRQAFDVILGGVAKAFDLNEEDPKTIARYDTSHLVRRDDWNHMNNRNRYYTHTHSIGKLLLLARRLCEAGCGFVTIGTDFVWDMHADVNNLGVEPGMQLIGRPFDHAVSAFIDDIEARGLSDDILLVCTGEMGRTPRINAKGGRDHWGALTPLMLYGGGLPRGQVIGQSTRDGGSPATTPVTTPNLIGTILQTLFDTGELRLETNIPRDIARLIADYEPIPELHS
jgi:hypothetical protein